MKKITKDDVISLMRNNGWLPRWSSWQNLISDKEFFLLPEGEYQKIIASDKTNEQAYIPESGDCDNYAFELRAAFGRMGAACGVIHVQPDGEDSMHALFFYITDERKLVAIEPQSDGEYSRKFTVLAVTMY